MSDDDSERRLRNQSRRQYVDAEMEDEDIESPRSYDVQEKLKSRDYHHSLVQEVQGTDVTSDKLMESGFRTPLLVKDKTGLGLRVPSKDFSPEDVKRCIGSRRVIDVMDVKTQKAANMSMKEFVRYYTERENREGRLLNLLSLEFSHSKLETYVEQPDVVRALDWVDNIWPQHYKYQQHETTNLLERMKYPKVQRYCLMSVAGCYTDFHIDMGGTSVWYHILHGRKIFWLIPPTPRNLEIYTQWTLSGQQQDIFLGDKVEKCQRIELRESWTFFIPTGWIHAVYTPVDSFVFGGNFLHSLGMKEQLKVWEIENRTHVPLQFRYPFFTEMHWYLVDNYLDLIKGTSYRVKVEEEEKVEHQQGNSLSAAEVDGLTEVVNFLKNLAPTKRCVPQDIKNPDQLLKDCQAMLQHHDPSVTSRFIQNCSTKKRQRIPKPKQRPPPGRSKEEHRKVCRRVRCRVCEPCRREDCGLCHYCHDMKKFGGPGIMKQCCLSRQCLAPKLPKTAKCQVCEMEDELKIKECITCYQIVHPMCLKGEEPGVDNEDLPNSWECPTCCVKSRGQPAEEQVHQHAVKRRASHSSDEPATKLPVYQYVVRPVPQPPPPNTLRTRDGEHTLEREHWLQVLSYLPSRDLATMLQVCKTFYVWTIAPENWRRLDLSDRRITKTILIGTVRRQPRKLILNGGIFSGRQLDWLVPRLPQLSALYLSRCRWVGGLHLPPNLRTLDLSWCCGFGDAEFAEMVSGGGARLREINMAGSDITDVTLDLLACMCPSVTCLGLSACVQLSDLGVQTLTSLTALDELDLTHCHDLTPRCLPHLTKLSQQGSLVRVHLDGALEASQIDDYCQEGGYQRKGGSVYYR